MLSSNRLAICALILLTACGGVGHFQPYKVDSGYPAIRPRVITNIDYVGAGDREAQDFVAQLQDEDRADVQQAILRAARACVRIEVKTRTSGTSYEASKGSGILMQGARPADAIRVGTAGHVLGSGGGQAWLVTSGGRELTVNSTRQQHAKFGTSNQDWGVMEIDVAVDDLPCVPVASPQNGELAFVLAYPDGIGRDAAGRLVYGRAVDAAALRPILTVGEVVQASPLHLRPIAGSIPLGGASGGAIVNRRGELIGLLNAVSNSFESDGVTYLLIGASSDAVGDVQ